MTRTSFLSSLIPAARPTDPSAGMTRTQARAFPRTQDRVLVVAAREDCLILRDTSVVAAIGFGSIDDTLLSDRQIDAMIEAFKDFLGLLRFDVQLLIGTRAQNLDALQRHLLARFDACAERQRQLIAFRERVEGHVLGTLAAMRDAAASGATVDVPARFAAHFGAVGIARPEALRGSPGEAEAVARDLARPEFFAELLHSPAGAADASAVAAVIDDLRRPLDRSIDLLDHWEQLLLERRGFHDAMLARFPAPVRTLYWVTRANPRLVTRTVKRGPLEEGEFRAARDELAGRCAQLMHGVARMALPAWRATGDELLREVAGFYHPSQPDLARRELRLDRSVLAQMATVHGEVR